MNANTTEQAPELPDQYVLWTRQEVKAILGIKSDSAFYRTIHAKGFPAPIKLTTKLARWRKSEVLNWLDGKPNEIEKAAHHVGRGGKH